MSVIKRYKAVEMFLMAMSVFGMAFIWSCGDDVEDAEEENDGTGEPVDLAEHCPGELDESIAPPLCTVAGGEITTSSTWIPEIQYLLSGKVFIGDGDETTTLTIEPGTLILGDATLDQGSALIIQRNSRIMAEGAAENPIVFTSSNEEGARAPGDWGGVVINGNAPINICDGAGCESEGEGETGLYGGDDAEDDSGTMRYVRIEFSGKQLTEESEFNGLALQGVGSKTTIEYIQIHRTSDDSLEFFGGTAQVKHMLLTGCGDDGFDWTQGWSGKAQYVIVEQADDIETNRGIEADNYADNNDAEPRANPTLYNFTILGSRNNTGELLGVMLREGTAGTLRNFVITGFDTCLDVDHDATWAQVDSGDLSIDYSMVEDASCFKVESDDSETTDVDESDEGGFMVEEDFWNAGDNNVIGDPDLDGWVPNDGSPLLDGGAPGSGWIEDAGFMGAVGSEDWTEGGWTDFPNS